MRRYLVTGGLGFLGAALTRALVAAGHRVRVLDDGSRGSLARLGEARPDVEVVSADIRDPAAVERALAGIDGVWHLAFVNGTRHFYERPAYVLEVGVKGILNVLDGCRRAGVAELFVASSSEVYQSPPSVPTDEHVPLTVPDPHNARYSYAGGKIISELLALHGGREQFERVVIFRPHNVFGPDMGWEHVVPQLTTRLVRLRATSGPGPVPLPIRGTGSQSRAFIYVEDCVAGLLLLLARGEHLGIYNVGTMEELTIAEVARRIGRCLDLEVRLVPGPEPPGGAGRRCPDTAKLAALGFRPRFTFDDGLRPTVAWYATHPAPASAVEAALVEGRP